MPITTLDKTIVQWFNSDFGTGFSKGIIGNLLLVLLSLLLAAFFSGLIGYEREKNGHNAGLRTHILVGVGSAVVMVLSIYGFGMWDGTRDPARLAAQVVSGIGFLGAGAIIQNGISVKGLTTATTLWVSMAIGLACGSGSFIVGTLATVVCLISVSLLRKLELFVGRHNPVILMVVPADKATSGSILKMAVRFGVQVRDSVSELIEVEGKPAIRWVLHCSSTKKNAVSALAEELRHEINPYEITVSTEELIRR